MSPEGVMKLFFARLGTITLACLCVFLSECMEPKPKPKPPEPPEPEEDENLFT